MWSALKILRKCGRREVANQEGWPTGARSVYLGMGRTNSMRFGEKEGRFM